MDRGWGDTGVGLLLGMSVRSGHKILGGRVAPTDFRHEGNKEQEGFCGQNKRASESYFWSEPATLRVLAALAGAEATAKLIEKFRERFSRQAIWHTRTGTAEEFRDCYGKTWGRFKDRTWPTPGNHEYGTPERRGVRIFGIGEIGRGRPGRVITALTWETGTSLR